MLCNRAPKDDSTTKTDFTVLMEDRIPSIRLSVRHAATNRPHLSPHYTWMLIARALG